MQMKAYKKTIIARDFNAKASFGWIKNVTNKSFCALKLYKNESYYVGLELDRCRYCRKYNNFYEIILYELMEL